jgi:hypothetical protein
MKNYSALVKSKEKRILTAKGNKFVWRCIDVAAEQRGLNRYSKELNPLKEKLRNLLHHLIIDKGLSATEIKAIIKESCNLFAK